MLTPHKPPKLPIELDYSKFARELADASFELGKLASDLRGLENPMLLVSPLTTKEAVTSSRIEGTVSTVKNVFEYEAGIKGPLDTIEVFNYRRAMTLAIETLKERQPNLSFIKELHNILLENTRGYKNRGKFRTEQVFIGQLGDTIEKATYIPPESILVPEYMENLEAYILQNSENFLVKVGIIHYQFEAIHPFNDGNGRIGRLFIPLYLYQRGQLLYPILYLSGYFDKNRSAYINTLHKVDITNEYEHWLKFFFIAVKEQAKETQLLIARICNLKRSLSDRLEEFKSPYTYKFIEFLFKRPVFTSYAAKAYLKADIVTVKRLIKKLLEMTIVVASQKRVKRKKVFVFADLMRLLE